MDEKRGISWLKTAWRRLVLRNIRYSSDVARLDRYYAVSDPWDMAGEVEQFRFKETNRLILEKFGRQDSILEIGCGEGHQSVYLEQVCAHLTGLDVSARAVSRARERCPKSQFLVGDVFCADASALSPFDLVVACEVIYYIRDVPAAVERIASLGRNGFVTYLIDETKKLDRQIMDAVSPAQSALIEFKDGSWRVMWWM